MNDIQRVIVIVLDGVGVGYAPDADAYGDVGSNSVGNVSRAVGGLSLPNMEALGLGHLTEIRGIPPAVNASGAYGKLTPTSAGKDSITGHWELMGVHLSQPFPTYPNGFPASVINEFSHRTGYGVIGNKAASGTEIIQELGAEHVETGKLIVYTSADSVFQIAAHEGIVPITELYKICETARDMLVGEHAVGRVIARPFIGDAQNGFTRTDRRHDYPVAPIGITVMDQLLEAQKTVYGVGKISDLFGGRGISQSFPVKGNEACTQQMLDLLPENFAGLLFVNLVEFDMIYGHRNDAAGYAGALKVFDTDLPAIRGKMRPTDIAIITGDHGVDPTTPSTDHSREYVPLLVFGEPVKNNVNLGTRRTYSDVAATIAEIFGLAPTAHGTSFLGEIFSGQ